MWEIYAYHNADSLSGILNAIAAIHASGDYAAALAAVAFFGFAAALLAYAFAPDKLQGWKWLASVVLIYSVLILLRVNVGIVDKTGSSPVRVVANVPFGIAALGSVSSTIGHTLTELFETAFQGIPGAGALPAELGYQRHGLMFGNRLIRESARLVFDDPGFRTDLSAFIVNCTRFDLLDGTVDPSVFSGSDNVWPVMSNPNPARFSSVRRNGVLDIDTCPRVYQSLDNRMPAQVERLQGRLALQLNPTLPAAAAAAVIADQVQQAYLRDGIADASATAAALIRQNAMLNVLQDAGQLTGQQANDPAAMVLAVGRAQASAQQNAVWLNYGKMAEQALPVFRNVIEALSYALFPLFILLLMLTSGRDTLRALSGYVALLVWIQLWPPLYAILNYMASVYAAFDLAAAANLGNGTRALSLQTASSIYTSAISGEAMVGYLVISIPFLAWAAVRRMENLGATLAGGITGLQGALTASTAPAAVGNTSLGNVAMDQVQLAPNRTSAFMQSRQDNLTGNTTSASVASGVQALSLLRNQGFASRVVSARVSEQQVSEASAQVDAARSDVMSAVQQHSSALSEAFMQGIAKHRSNSRSTSTTNSGYEQWGKSLDELDQISKSVAQSTGSSQNQVATLAFGANATLGLNLGLAGANTTAGALKNYASGLSAEDRLILGSLSNEQLAKFRQFGDRVTRDASAIQAFAVDDRSAHDIASRIEESKAKVTRSDTSLQERQAHARRTTAAYEAGEVLTIDIAQDPHNVSTFARFASQYGGTSSAAAAMISAELARQGLRPTPITPHMDSSDEVKRRLADWREEEAAKNPAIPNPSRSISTPDPRARSNESSGHRTRSEVTTAGEDLQLRVQRSQTRIEESGPKRDSEGTLRGKRSLAAQSGSQASKDLKDTPEMAIDAAKNLLNKRKKAD